jgi:hypothetical protein
MAAKYILGAFAVVFLVAAAARGSGHPQGRIWLLVGAIFAAVTLWLFVKG